MTATQDRKEYLKQYHKERKKNPQYMKDRRNYSISLKQDKFNFVREIVGDTCVDCGEDRISAIQYHHPNGRTKPYRALPSLGWKELKEEVMNIIALCASCHLIRHRNKTVMINGI